MGCDGETGARVRRAVAGMILEDYGDVAAMIEMAMEVAMLPGVEHETLEMRCHPADVVDLRLFKRYSVRGWGVKVVLAEIEIEHDWPDGKVVDSVVRAVLHAATAVTLVDGVFLG